MASSLVIQKLDEVWGIDEVSVDAHGQTVRGIDEEWLSLGSAFGVMLARHSR